MTAARTILLGILATALSSSFVGCAGVPVAPDPAIEAQAARMSLDEAAGVIKRVTSRSNQALREWTRRREGDTAYVNEFVFGADEITRTQTGQGWQAVSKCRYEELKPYYSNTPSNLNQLFFAFLNCPEDTQRAAIAAVDVTDVQRAVAALLRWRNSTPEERRFWLEKDEREFAAALESYRAAAAKHELPEEARRFKVQAEGAVRDKDFAGAAGFYKRALQVAPWWPEGRFNRALVLSETGDFQGAMTEMKRYLALVPDAPNARAAQDKIYAWEGGHQ